MRSKFRIAIVILGVGPAMDIYSKFGVCLICMLALVLLAVTPSTATSSDIIDSTPEPMPASLQHPLQINLKRSLVLDMNTGTVQRHRF